MFIPWRIGLAEAHPLTNSRWWPWALVHFDRAELSHLELQRRALLLWLSLREHRQASVWTGLIRQAEVPDQAPAPA